MPTASTRIVAILTSATVLPGCSTSGFFRTDQLITVTETSTELVPTATTITSVTNPATAMRSHDVYEVGKDIAAGTYVTDGPRFPGSYCKWELLPNEDAPFEQALAFDYVGGPAQLVLALGDIVRAGGACEWTLRP